MLKYAVVEISGRQYKVEPNKPFLVSFLGEVKKMECDKVLLLSDGDKIQVGMPYLKNKLSFDVLNTKKGEKIRVMTYKAKANTRKVRGSRAKYSKIQLTV